MFSKYELKGDGFSWLWYYAMQQMGDDESKIEREAMYRKIEKRESLSNKIAQFFPSLLLQLGINDIAKTGLTNQVEFLNATTYFHEDLRLGFYPKIFDNEAVNQSFLSQKKTFVLLKTLFAYYLLV